MPAEADNPKTGTIAWITAVSLILIFVAFVALQGLFEIWEVRHEQRTGTGNLESPLAAYNREQVLKLNDLEAAMKQTLEDAKAGKVLAAPPPPTPAPPANPTPANPNPATPPAK